MQLFVYPWHNINSKELVTAENFKAPENLQLFYRHLMQNQRIIPTAIGDSKLMAKTGRKISKIIEAGEESWRDCVPEESHAMVIRKLNR